MWGRPQTDPGFGTICVFETICRVRLSCANNPFFGRKNRNGTKPTRIGALGGPSKPLKIIGSEGTEGGEGFKGAYIGGEGGTSSEDCLLSQSPAKEDSGSCWCSLLSGERWGGPGTCFRCVAAAAAAEWQARSGANCALLLRSSEFWGKFTQHRTPGVLDRSFFARSQPLATVAGGRCKFTPSHTCPHRHTPKDHVAMVP